jgi:LAO/AO transport system kinase
MSVMRKPEDLLQGVLDGNVRAIARMMSLAESKLSSSRDIISDVYKHAGKAHIVGLTGVPGSGKSTMVRALTQHFRKLGKKVGIVAVDPSSPFSGGAILGDRVRMGDLTTDDGVFIRSLATRGALGGLARACLDTVDVLDAAGFDMVLIETVGVGQDEVDIAGTAHSIVVVSAPGLGDGVQAIKAGVLEIADIHAVSKCDRPDATETLSDIRSMMHLGLQGRDRFGWDVPVIGTSAETGEGIEVLGQSILSHRQHLDQSGEWPHRQRKITETRIIKAAEDMIRDALIDDQNLNMDELIENAEARKLDPTSAARKLIKNIKIDV